MCFVKGYDDAHEGGDWKDLKEACGERLGGPLVRERSQVNGSAVSAVHLMELPHK
jgi:hypothetical protein